jgi:membrane fusion protein (multidrug efflux system)
MKKILSYLLPAVILIGIVGAIAVQLKKNKAIAAERVFHADTLGLQPGNDAHLTSKPETGGLLFTGIFEPFRETKVSSEIQGKINYITVDAGSRVTKGQALVQLDDALLQLQLQSAEVQIEGLSADVKRYSILTKSDAVQGVQLEKAELGLKAAQIQRATILEQINKTSIKSPFNGIVYSKLSEVGSFAAPGVPLLHILDVGQMRFTVNVPENDLKYFRPGELYEIKADAFPEKKLKGKMIYMAGKANPGNSFAVQFLVENLPDHALRAGMFGRIDLSIKN